MSHITLLQIKTKPGDYCLCECGMFKWYEHTHLPCAYCGGKKYGKPGKGVAKAAGELIKSYVEDDGYTESEAEDIETDAY